MYVEEEETKMALVKVTMCETCAAKLQFHTTHKKLSEGPKASETKKRANEEPVDLELTPAAKRMKDQQ